MADQIAPPPPCSDDEDNPISHKRTPPRTDPSSLLNDFILINDAVHIESITLRRAWRIVVDTPAFQSLREKRFLGFCDSVYLGAKATVFDHCLGTYHVARKILASLKLKQKWLIDDVDEYCIEIAALFAYSGRAPYFHVFSKLWGSDYDPKKMAVRIFSHVMAEYVHDKLDVFLSPMDILFIKELIDPPITKWGPGDIWLMHGRPKEKAFLYEIVVNTDSGLDARFLDYITRSCIMANYGINFNLNTLGRIVNTILVVSDGNKSTLVYSAAVLRNIQDMFQSSVVLDGEVVTHKKVIAFEMTLEKALHLAESYACQGTDNRVPLFRIHEDVKAFIRLGDDIISNIINSTDEALLPAAQLLETLHHRKTMKCIAQIRLADKDIDLKRLRSCIRAKLLPENHDSFTLQCIHCDGNLTGSAQIGVCFSRLETREVKFYDCSVQVVKKCYVFVQPDLRGDLIKIIYDAIQSFSSN